MSLGGRGGHGPSSSGLQSTKITSFFKRATPPEASHASHASDGEKVKWKPSPAKRQRMAPDEVTKEQPPMNDISNKATTAPSSLRSLLFELSEPSWVKALEEELRSPSFKRLEDFVSSEMSSKTVFPPRSDIFRAFNQTPLENVKVCIIGQDPYHGPGQAMGLSFSVPKSQPIPSSLKNIYKVRE
jgi:hypothetical protein